MNTKELRRVPRRLFITYARALIIARRIRHFIKTGGRE